MAQHDDTDKESLSTQLVLVVLVACLLTTGLIFYYSEQDRERSAGYQFKRALAYAEQIAATQQTILASTESFLRNLVQAPALNDLSSPRCNQYLASLLSSSTMFVNLGVPGIDGDLRCNALPLTRAINVADRGYFQQAIKQRSFAIGSFQHDRAAGVTSVNFAYPVINANSGLITGVAVAVVSLQWWNERLQEFRFQPGTQALLADAAGVVVASYPASEEQLGQPLHSSGIERHLKAGQLTATELVEGADGITRAFAHTRLYNAPDDMPVTVSVGIPVDRSVSGMRRWLLYLLWALFTFVVLFGGWVLSRALRLRS